LNASSDIVQCGYDEPKALRCNDLLVQPMAPPRKLLILMMLRGWLAALDDFRNWLIREAA
jgi:hypothetical protein